jgi:hypothetical protein
MKKLIFFCSLSLFLIACNSDKTKTETPVVSATDSATSTTQPAVELPFKAYYSSSWSDNVSDEDLKMVMNTYKDWSENNITGLQNALADSVDIDMSSGDHFKKTGAEIAKMWSTYRDSLSSVKINMAAWHKMYSTDKNDAYIVTWYDETDTYKNGKVDSASYHDINQVKNGKIVWYSQYKRPKK